MKSYQVELWYTAESRLPTPEDPSAPIPFDRTSHIQALFFDIFSDENCEPPMLDYKNMVSHHDLFLLEKKKKQNKTKQKQPQQQ